MNPTILSALRSGFNSFDKDHYGKVNIKEFQSVVNILEKDAFSESELQEAIRKFGDSQSGTIDFLGVQKFVDEKLMSFCEDKEEDLQPRNEDLTPNDAYLLTVFDKSGKGKMSLEQFQKALSLEGATLDEETAKDLLIKYDSDKDGFLNYNEYVEILLNEI